MLKAVPVPVPASVPISAPTPEPVDRFAALHPDVLSANEQSSVVDLALAIVSRCCQPGQPLRSDEDVGRFLRLRYAGRRNELFGVIYLTTKHCLIEVAEHFFGTIDGTAVHSRVVVERALTCNAAAAIAFHNHPSGCAEPSETDINMTRTLRKTLALIDVRLLDHFVVTGSKVVSLADRGLC